MLRINNFFLICIVFFWTILFLLFFTKSILGFNVLIEFFDYKFLKFNYLFFLDMVSIFFVMLSMFLLIICIFLFWYWVYKLGFFLFMIFLSMLCLLNIFFFLDIFLVFFFFELILIPMFFFIGIWGSRQRKVYAAYLLFIYTLIGSIFALIAFIYFYLNLGSSNFFFFLLKFIEDEIQFIFFFFLLLGFSVKVPMIPVHIWLPEAHVEAPTPGSVLLAGIILKLSFYFFFRVLVFTLSIAVSYFIFLVFVLGLIGLYLPSFAAISQLDMKKIIAYSSVSHMNFALMGLFSTNFIAILGTFFLMFGHAIVSSALFSTIGVIYDRYKSRLLNYYNGMVLIMPLFSVFLFFFVLANFGFPSTINFVGEFTIFLGLFLVSKMAIFLSLIGLFFTLIYTLNFYTRLVYGNLKVEFIRYFCDLTRKEFFIFLPFVLCMFWGGINPAVILDYVTFDLYFWSFF